MSTTCSYFYHFFHELPFFIINLYKFFVYSAEQPTSIMFSRNIFSQLVLVMNITGMDAEETTQKDRKIPKLEFLGPKVVQC